MPVYTKDIPYLASDMHKPFLYTKICKSMWACDKVCPQYIRAYVKTFSAMHVWVETLADLLTQTYRHSWVYALSFPFKQSCWLSTSSSKYSIYRYSISKILSFCKSLHNVPLSDPAANLSRPNICAMRSSVIKSSSIIHTQQEINTMLRMHQTHTHIINSVPLLK